MKRISSIVLALVLTLSFAIPSLADTVKLNDLGDSKYKVEIEKLVEDGTISGYLDGTFKPQNGITRGELARIIAVTLNLEEDKNVAEHFTDVRGKWNQGSVGALYKANIMIGVSSDKFGQEQNVTREELAVILLRTFGLEETVKELDLDIEFKDAEDISAWARNAVAFVKSIGLMDGIENEDGSFTFLPKSFGERELVAKLVYELKYNREKYTEIIAIIMEESNSETKKDEKKTEDNSKKDNTVGDKSSANKSNENKPNENKPSQSSIVSKYRGQLLSLRSSVNGELSSLISSAVAEYKSGGDYNEIYSRYMDMAYELEADTDSQVSSILSELSRELSENGYNTEVISELEAEYQEAKDEARDSI
ncbi:S-layer homology domain-containing protein [Tissierella pigra]|nr:S-layer homology domain-containing protein [Tissierella pigra]